jgi:hypothetical protein
VSVGVALAHEGDGVDDGVLAAHAVAHRVEVGASSVTQRPLEPFSGGRMLAERQLVLLAESLDEGGAEVSGGPGDQQLHKI